MPEEVRNLKNNNLQLYVVLEINDNLHLVDYL